MNLYNLDIENINKVYPNAVSGVYSLPALYYGMKLMFYPRITNNNKRQKMDSFWQIFEASLEPTPNDTTDLVPAIEFELFINLESNAPIHFYQPYITPIYNILKDNISDKELYNLIFYYYVGVYLQCFPIFIPFLSNNQLESLKSLDGEYALSITDKIMNCVERPTIYYAPYTPEDIYQRLYFSPSVGLPLWVSQFLSDIRPMTNEYCAIYTPSRLKTPPNHRRSRTFYF